MYLEVIYCLWNLLKNVERWKRVKVKVTCTTGIACSLCALFTNILVLVTGDIIQKKSIMFKQTTRFIAMLMKI
jgi:hypothetical protein